jgi:uncharacterized repeat protein (TIGR01451 family)
MTRKNFVLWISTLVGLVLIALSLTMMAVRTSVQALDSPSITVVKDLVPDTDLGKFNLQIDGTPYATDIGDGGTTGPVVVITGSHTVTETASTGTNLADYITVIGGDCAADGSISLAAGDNKTCTITNTRKTQLTVNKVLLPNSDSGQFNLQIDGTPYATDVGHDGTTGPVAVSIGSHTVTETASTGTNLADYITVIGGDCDTSGNITLALGENKTCTITNTKLGSITIVKETDPAGGTGFSFDAGSLGSFSLDDGDSQGFENLASGDYTVTETVPTGWGLTGVVCTGGDSIPTTDGVTIHLDPGENITCTFTNEELTCPASMISYWKLDETSGTTFDDYYNGNDASCSTDHCPDFATGRVSGALDFNGTSDYLTVEDDDSLDWASDASFTIELWAKFSNASSKNKVMIGRDQTGGTHWWLGAKQDSGTVVFQLKATDGSGGSITGYTPTNDDQWHHIVAVKDGSTNQNRLYVDGIEEDSETYTYTAGFDATTTLGIGYMAYHGVPDYYYDGLLDEIALHSVALSEVEIQQHYLNGLAEHGYCEVFPPEIRSTPVTEAAVGWLYNYDVDAIGNPVPTYALTTGSTGMMIDGNTGLISWTPDVGQEGSHNIEVEASNSEGTDTQTFSINVAEAGPCPVGMISYWKLDETSGTTFDDYYNDNNAECPGTKCPTPAIGQVNGGQAFDGSNDEINVPADASLDWGANDSFSIEFWMKRSGTINVNDVIVGRDDPSTSLHWWVGVSTSGKPHYNLAATNGDGTSVAGTTNLNDGYWHHVVAVRDADNGVNLIYVDGRKDGSTPKLSYSAGFGSATAALNIGWLSLSKIYTYDGIVDEVALYNKALSPAEIQQHYQNGLAGLGHCASIAIAKEANQTVVSGSTVTFTISIINTGVVDMENVTVTDAPVPDCDKDLGVLDAGDITGYTCTVAEVITDFTNSATVTSTTFVGVQVTDTDTASVHVTPEGRAIYLPIILKNLKQ